MRFFSGLTLGVILTLPFSAYGGWWAHGKAAPVIEAIAKVESVSEINLGGFFK